MNLKIRGPNDNSLFGCITRFTSGYLIEIGRIFDEDRKKKNFKRMPSGKIPLSDKIKKQLARKSSEVRR